MNASRSTATLDDHTRSYFRMHHESPRHRWWRPLAELTVASLALVVLFGLLLLAAAFLSFVPVIGPLIDAAFESEVVDNTDPTEFLLSNLMLILLIPAVLIGVRLARARPVGSVLSVTGHFRWERLLRAALITTPIYLLFFAVSFAIEPGHAPVFDRGAWLFLALVVLSMPFQSAAEEIVFRGLLGQMIGAWLRHPLWAILLPIPLFVVGHDYSTGGLLDIGVFAFCAGVLAWRTGGLEAPIALHVVNNVLVGTFGAFEVFDLNDTTVSWLESAFGCTLTIVATAAILWFEARASASESALTSSEGQREAQLARS